jgi:hypothetical protein
VSRAASIDLIFDFGVSCVGDAASMLSWSDIASEVRDGELWADIGGNEKLDEINRIFLIRLWLILSLC